MPGRMPTQLFRGIQETCEWTDMSRLVIVRMLDELPFFGALLPSRRTELAELMSVATYEPGAILFNEGDDYAPRIYFLSDGTPAAAHATPASTHRTALQNRVFSSPALTYAAVHRCNHDSQVRVA